MSGSGRAVEALQEQLMDAWIAFARSGDPSHDGIGGWPVYDNTDRATMVFDLESGVQYAPFEEERAIWESLIATTST